MYSYDSMSHRFHYRAILLHVGHRKLLTIEHISLITPISSEDIQWLNLVTKSMGRPCVKTVVSEWDR
jgi:hypothetical protein